MAGTSSVSKGAADDLCLDALVPWLQPSTEQMRRVVDEILNGDGYVVLPGVLSKAECARELDRMWDFVTKVSPTVKRGDPRTWYPSPSLPSPASPSSSSSSTSSSSAAASTSAEAVNDPWPHAQKDRFQLHHAGWVFSDLREALAARVFEPLFGTAELHCSKDGFTFHRPTGPTCKASAGPDNGRAVGTSEEGGLFTPPAFMKGPRHQGTDDEHFDQGAHLAGLQCIQGSVSLLDQSEDDGCFLCWPRSHRCFSALMAAREASQGPGSATAKHGGSQYYVPLTKKEVALLRQGAFGPEGKGGGRRVPVRRGDVVLWRSDLVHAGASPRGPLVSKVPPHEALAAAKKAAAAAAAGVGSAQAVSAQALAHAAAVGAAAGAAGVSPPAPPPPAFAAGSGPSEGGHPGTGGFRAVVYVCMAPAALTPEPVYDEKLRAYQKLETAGHWPGREDWFVSRDRPVFRPYFASPPELTERQSQLYGLVRYDDYRFEHDVAAVAAAEHAAIVAAMAGQKANRRAAAASPAAAAAGGGVEVGGDSAAGSVDDDDDGGGGGDGAAGARAYGDYDGDGEGRQEVQPGSRRRHQRGKGAASGGCTAAGTQGGGCGLSSGGGSDRWSDQIDDDPLMSGWSGHGGMMGGSSGGGRYGASVGDGGAWVQQGECGPSPSRGGGGGGGGRFSQSSTSSGGLTTSSSSNYYTANGVRYFHQAQGGSVDACADSCTSRDQAVLLGPCVPCTFY